MNFLQLKLEHQAKGKKPPTIVAGWLPSADPTEWLRESAQWRMNGSTQDLSILPITLSGTVKGALLLPDKTSGQQFGHTVQPLIELSENVYTVEGAQLNASILDREIDYLFPQDLYLFLPSLGLIAFTKEHAIPPSAFISALKSEVSWNQAIPAPPPAPKLTSIIVPLPPEEDFNLEQINEDGIGSDRDKKIQRSNKEPGLTGKLGAGIGIGLAGLAAAPILGIGKLMSILPAGSSMPGQGSAPLTPSSFEKLHDWARRHFKDLTDARQRELNKLIDLMNSDPERGLRHALPLGGHEARRGPSAPGWRLGERSTRLGSNRGGAASDGWDLDYETRLTLERQYRKAAKDAEDNQNFERAAYIYGELLNDWANAARSLKKAGRYRDAVGIYLHKLKDKRRAAECLESANQLSQAAELYTELKQFEKAGDIYARLELNKQAHRSWQSAVEIESNPLEKARITHSKLQDFDGAIHILDQAWRSNQRSVACIQKQFTLLNQQSHETESLQLIEDLLDANDSILTPLEKNTICYKLRADNHTEQIKSRAKAGILKVTSETLLAAPNSESSKQLLKLLPSLDKTDILLKRDATRFSYKHVNMTPVKLGERSGHLTASSIITIPEHSQWHSISASTNEVSIAGIDQTSLVFAKLERNNCVLQPLDIKDTPNGFQKINHISLKSSSNVAHVFHFSQAQKIHFQLTGHENQELQDQLGADQRILAIGPSGKSDFISLKYTETAALVLNYHDIHGAHYKTDTLDLAPPEIADAAWYCAERSGHSCFSAKNFAAWRYPEGKIVPIQLYEPIRKLVFSPSPHPISAILSGDSGLSLVTPHRKEKEPEFINLHTSNTQDRPIGCYSNNGEIIVVCGTEGRVFNPKNIVSPAATFNIPSDVGEPIDISANGPRGFCILTLKSKILSYN